MIAVIFEVHISEDKKAEYLDIAAELKPLLVDIDGFISIERFQSLNDDSKILSLSFWRDEQAIKQWRELETHRLAQSKGRAGVFDNYRLRVAGVIRDYGMHQREQTPEDSVIAHNS
ncbi:antibiotic biosynthesis monooxygenase family protein [Shewanella fidelis]|uniref:antibiotic biosynthesis monooxygenase family protein n=1 Tax=Shewanella fidelis TaxID=173509 RepID=UPI00048C362A|nr:antibiotic biosynthesis monooxygenase [Shewanella fidelis]